MLVDDFDDGIVDPVLWPQSYGDPQEAGGTARIPCTTGYAAYRSAGIYTLTWSQISARVVPPASGGATSAAISMLVLSDVGGTDAGFLIDAAQHALGLYSHDAYADPGAVFLTYDDVAHAYLRLREDAGSLYWETSGDGQLWTVQRSAGSPAWTAQTDLSLLFEAHRDAGTNDFAEVDQLNVTRASRCVAADRRTGAVSSLSRLTAAVSGG